MSAAGLANLDCPPELSLEPAFERNLAALAVVDEALARRFAACAPPAAWRPVRALDGFPCWIDATREPGWPDGSALPRQRAVALLRSVPVKPETSVALPTLGDGAMADVLLEYLGPRQAVFVCITRLEHAAALLRLHDWAAALQRGRLILVPDESDQTLSQLYERWPGLEPPVQIIAAPHVPRPRIDVASEILRRALERAAPRRRARAVELSVAPAADRPPELLIAFNDPVLPAAAARRLAEAVSQMGVPDDSPMAARLLARDCPLRAGSLAALDCVSGGRIARVLSVGVEPGPLLAALAARPDVHSAKRACWHLTRPLDPPAADPNCLHLAASPMIAADLTAHGVPATHLRRLLFAAPPVDEAEDTEPRRREVVLLADLPPSSAAACGVTQPTHKLLWAALQERIAAAWQRGVGLRPEGLLAVAERAANLPLTAPELRARMLRLIEHVLIPAAEAQTILRAIEACALPVRLVGRGWNEAMEAADARRAAQPAATGAEVGVLATAPALLSEADWRRRPLAAIVARGVDPLRPELLEAAARSWPLILWTARDAATKKELGDVLRPDEHYAAVADGAELRAALQTCDGGREKVLARARRARAHVLATASYRVRAKELMELLR